MKYSNSYQSCGYDSCPCRGINFISRGGFQPITTDYCVDGKRVRIRDSQPLPRALFLYELDKYAEYLKWRTAQRAKFGGWEPPVQPFDHILEVAA